MKETEYYKLEDRQIEVVKRAAADMAKKHKWKPGQAFYNALFALYPIVAQNIRHTHVDPFDNDNNIDKCIKHIHA